ncbi:MAG TPA: enoyl-CoA hydratase-related protein [Acidimicrobiales bacterium]|nr:enoyl-CoA hydratase-related protein [Acidimicrobiales bacterium]
METTGPGTETTATDVLVSRPRPEVALVTLNRPERLNALTSTMLAHIYEVLQTLGRDATCRVIVVTGAGRGFCAGDDLRDYTPPAWVPADVGPVHSNMYQQKYVAELVPRLRALPQPVIAAVNGPAAGAGYALALGADLRVAAASAVFVDAFVKIGASGAEMGLSWLLQRIVGATRAAELVLTGRRVDAAEAARIGLVLETVPDGEVVDAALALAELIVVNTPLGTWMGKATLWSNLEIPSLEAAIDLEARTQILTLGTEDAKEQLQAFRDDRPARYTNR